VLRGQRNGSPRPYPQISRPDLPKFTYSKKNYTFVKIFVFNFNRILPSYYLLRNSHSLNIIVISFWPYIGRKWAGIVKDYAMDDRAVGVRVPVGTTFLSSPRPRYRLTGPPSAITKEARNELRSNSRHNNYKCPLHIFLGCFRHLSKILVQTLSSSFGFRQ
jgi:hypothetical protein